MAYTGRSTTFTAEELRNVPLPNFLPCMECQCEKAPSQFANKHIRNYQFLKLTQPKYVVSPRRSTMKCRMCTGEQLQELKCQGQCGFWKPLQAFSKNQRTNGEYWCKDCVLWKTSQEPGGAVVPAPGHDLAPDEDDNVPASGYYDPEDGDEDGLFDDQISLVPSTSIGWDWGQGSDGVESAMAKMSIDRPVAPSKGDYVPPHLRGFNNHSTRKSATPSVDRSPAPSIASKGDYVPPHLRGSNNHSTRKSATPSVDRSPAPSIASKGDYVPPHLRGFNNHSTRKSATPSEARSPAPSVASTSTAKASADYIPPHLRSLQGLSTKSVSSASNPWEDTKSTTSTNDNTGHPIQFTAYDPSGQAHIKYRQSSGSTTTPPRPAMQGTPSHSGPYAGPPVATSDSAGRSGNWAKPTGNRNTGNKYVAPRKLARRPGYDSDGSQDEM